MVCQYYNKIFFIIFVWWLSLFGIHHSAWAERPFPVRQPSRVARASQQLTISTNKFHEIDTQREEKREPVALLDMGGALTRTAFDRELKEMILRTYGINIEKHLTAQEIHKAINTEIPTEKDHMRTYDKHMVLIDTLRKKGIEITPNKEAAKREHRKAQEEEEVQLYPGTIEAIKRLRDKDIPLIVISDKTQKAAERSIKNMPIAPMIDKILGTGSKGNIKTGKLEHIIALSQAGFGRMIYIADRAGDAETVEKAQETGIPIVMILVWDGYAMSHERQRLLKNPAVVGVAESIDHVPHAIELAEKGERGFFVGTPKGRENYQKFKELSNARENPFQGRSSTDRLLSH